MFSQSCSENGQKTAKPILKAALVHESTLPNYGFYLHIGS
jgi:hypothetical protein